MRRLILCFLVLTLAAFAGESPRLRVLPGITHGRLTIFPVVADSTRDTSGFITLDEGLRSGRVVVTEGGQGRGLRRGSRSRPVEDDVNRLLLVNNSDRPLLLLAGEIVTGGKQDRVVAKDRIVPAHGEPVDLSVFCVESGRWAEKTVAFGGLSSQMAQPTVRAGAMAAKDQQKVWDAVAAAKESVTVEVSAEAVEVQASTSYAVVVDNKAVKRKLAQISDPIERAYRKAIGELENRNAVGVVVAVNGRMVWADVFASPQLLQTYWPKLIRSYAAEVVGLGPQDVVADQKGAQVFVEQLQGRHEKTETEPSVFRHTEIQAEGYRVFVLTSLVPKTGFDLHIAKMSEDTGKPIPLRR